MAVAVLHDYFLAGDSAAVYRVVGSHFPSPRVSFATILLQTGKAAALFEDASC